MTSEEKLVKVCNRFSLLDEDKQNYILGIMQALVYAHDEYKKATLGGKKPAVDGDDVFTGGL